MMVWTGKLRDYLKFHKGRDRNHMVVPFEYDSYIFRIIARYISYWRIKSGSVTPWVYLDNELKCLLEFI